MDSETVEISQGDLRGASELVSDLRSSEKLSTDDEKRHSTISHFAAIFVLRSSQPSILHAHLPQLIATASLAQPELPPIRLVQLPKGCDARLCVALGLSRVSFIGILEGAPHSRSLIDFVRDNVPEIEVPWLEEVRKMSYMPVKINAIETSVLVAKKPQNPP
jgi:ribonuclease P/MRP protein subunit POP3